MCSPVGVLVKRATRLWAGVLSLRPSTFLRHLARASIGGLHAEEWCAGFDGVWASGFEISRRARYIANFRQGAAVQLFDAIPTSGGLPRAGVAVSISLRIASRTGRLAPLAAR